MEPKIYLLFLVSILVFLVDVLNLITIAPITIIFMTIILILFKFVMGTTVL
ncbi:hypothetical protein MetfoDRAFT_2015 [Methanotorris formicicus Mc-S-70]|uniref:Uncharacterized protein n=1 Tax=Methanotorris formicicus Mc-S-70 TaxID=647171 RepID=H1L1U1_9EURY|nr:hypothetical protein MetfoDRAFT_2015 [Methanotorris formicicus Mc-S-70]